MSYRGYRVLYADRDRDGSVRINGAKFGDWLRTYRKTVVMCADSVKGSDMVSLMTHPQDTASGNPGNVSGVTLKTATGSVKVMRLSDVWGLSSSDASDAERKLEPLRAMCAESAIDWRPTAAGTAINVLSNLCRVGPFSPPRYRYPFYTAIHAGPMVHIRGGCIRGAHIDRNSAYLYEMAQPMPSGTPYLYEHSSIARHLSVPSIVYAEVDVSHTSTTNQLPPLPVSTRTGRMVYPVGRFRGIWPSCMLAPAVDRGEVRILSVPWSIRWSSFEAILLPFVARMQSIPRAIAKPMYTRVWGKMSAQGGWTGYRNQGDQLVPSGDLWWRCNGKPQNHNAFPAYHRPDIAAWIVGRNHAAMVDAVRSTADESLVAAHVDALWTSDVDGARKLIGPDVGGWKLEGTGKIRYYSQGRYIVLKDDGTAKVGYSGWDRERAPSLSELHEWAGKRSERSSDVRGWLSRPEETMHARSVAPDVTDQTYSVLSGFAPDAHNVWTVGGQFSPSFDAFISDKGRQTVCKHGMSPEDCTECL